MVLPQQPWTEGPDTPNGSAVYCVYSNSTFAGGRGISLITTPEMATYIAQMHAFTQPKSLKDINTVLNRPYVSQSIPGRGVGLFATRTLHRGDKIFSHTPLLIVHRTTFSTLEDSVRFEMQNRAVDLLPDPSRELYLELYGQFGGDRVNDILFTNSFQVYFGEDGVEHNAILPEAARTNHDCRPNAHYYFDENTLTHHVVASRTIHTGEELSLSYTDMMLPRAERQAAIQFSWGFECTCSLCSLPEALIHESDKRLKLISKLEALLDDWSDGTTATPQMADALVSLYNQEHLYAPMAVPYTYAALAYSGVGDEYVALKYAALAVESGVLEAGPEHPDVLAMQEFMKDLTGHWSWKLRL
ncbi:hypothetical protein BU17DRAFT_40324 [Hysterangium stoloniferum]|nr:hypothetical protein BU17DRAFT_40324 [Hysterangium stoloniferum]